MQTQWAYRLPFALQCASLYSSLSLSSGFTDSRCTARRDLASPHPHRSELFPSPQGSLPALTSRLSQTIFAPESPWWLVRQGRKEDARRQIERLYTNPTEQEVENQLSLMVHTNALEKSIAAGTSYWDCFKGVDLRRTEIACGVRPPHPRFASIQTSRGPRLALLNQCR